MKKKLGRIIAFILTVIMAFSLSIGVMAEDAPAAPGKADWFISFIDDLAYSRSILLRALFNNKNGNIPDNYNTKLDPKGAVEGTYVQNGLCEVKEYSQTDSSKRIRSYRIFYPAELETSDQTYPVIVMVNGTPTDLINGPCILPELLSGEKKANIEVVLG